MSDAINRALLVLNDEICSFNRLTGREYTVVLRPSSPDEVLHASVDGKPVATENAPRAVAMMACDVADAEFATEHPGCVDDRADEHADDRTDVRADDE